MGRHLCALSGWELAMIVSFGWVLGREAERTHLVESFQDFVRFDESGLALEGSK